MGWPTGNGKKLSNSQAAAFTQPAAALIEGHLGYIANFQGKKSLALKAGSIVIQKGSTNVPSEVEVAAEIEMIHSPEAFSMSKK